MVFLLGLAVCFSEEVNTGHLGKEVTVGEAQCAAPLNHLGKAGQLGPAQGRKQVRQSIVETDLGVFVVTNLLPGLAGEISDVVRTCCIVGEQRAAAGGGHDLVAVEGQRGCVSEGTRRSPVALGADGLCGVRQHWQVPALGQRGDRTVVRNLAEEVDGQYRLDRCGLCPPILVRLDQEIDRDGAALVAVDQNGTGAGVEDRVDGGRKGHGRGQDDVAGPDAKGQQTQVECGGAAGQRDGVLSVGGGRQLTLERVYLRAQRRNPP